MELREMIYENAAIVRDRLDVLLGGCYYSEDLVDAMKYTALGGGKFIRSFLVRSFCECFGGKADDCLDFAAAVEMIHAYSLIHDDLPCMDNDDMRRGKPSNHKRFGEAEALLAGDALLTKAFETLALSGKEPQKIVKAVKVLSQCAGADGMVGGQMLELGGMPQNARIENLMRVYDGKTIALIKASCLLGVIAAGADSKAEEIAEKYGKSIGMTFQVVDDILDVIGNVEDIGKKTGSDLKNGKTTSVTIYGLDKAKEIAADYCRLSREAVSQCDKSGVLSQLADFLLNRTK